MINITENAGRAIGEELAKGLSIFAEKLEKYVDSVEGVRFNVSIHISRKEVDE